jgi:hypothetical protein
MKTTKGGKVMNPTDAYRKELRKKELKRVRKAPLSLVGLALGFALWLVFFSLIVGVCGDGFPWKVSSFVFRLWGGSRTKRSGRRCARWGF